MAQSDQDVTTKKERLYHRALVLITEWMRSGDDCSSMAQAALDGDVDEIERVERYRKELEGEMGVKK